jgi:putative hydrolase of the HAD superfamily
MALKEEVAHLIAVHPDVVEFLVAARAAGKRLVLATNAHHKSLTLKMAKTGLEPHFDALVSSHALGAAKEQQQFWERLHSCEPFDPQRTVLVDDSLPVLDAARAFGIAHLVAVRSPDTQQPPKDTRDYLTIERFADLLPVGGERWRD